MKINQLVPTTKFVIDLLGQENKYELMPEVTHLQKLQIINRYAHFMGSNIDMSMFVPCHESNVPLLEADNMEEEDYNQAVDNIIFPGFRVEMFLGRPHSITNDIVHIFWYDTITNTWNPSKGLKTMDDLAIYGLEMDEEQELFEA